jgi:hypothetical protein
MTGASLVWLDVRATGWSYFANPKLQAKVAIVCLLTLNGFLLHSTVMPAMKKAGALLKLHFSQRLFAIVAGSVSAVSWFYAAMLGVARPLNWNYSLMEIVVMYPVFVASAIATMLMLVTWAKYVHASRGIAVPAASLATLARDRVTPEHHRLAAVAALDHPVRERRIEVDGVSGKPVLQRGG